MNVALEFHGAAKQVTGSRHLLGVGKRRVLLECGMVQGPRRLADRANRELGIDPGNLDAVVLSHAHIDHSGSLPRLVRLGYRGPIWCTHATRDLLRLMLMDSAQIQAADARYLRKRGHEVEPAYTTEDVERTLRQVRSADYHETFEATDGVAVEFLDAGHILGSAIVVLDVHDSHQKRRVVFTGDHGRRRLPILRDPERMPECDVLITESTYGDRLHETVGDMGENLAAIVSQEQEDGGRILIPAFAVGRTQNIVLTLGQLIAGGRIPRVPVFVDTPMGREATKIMAGHTELYDRDTRAILRRGESPFYFENVRYVADVEESKSLNGVRSGVVVAASGMCESGRILHHLKQTIGRPQDCVLIVGFQAEHTLGRRLLDGAERVNILGEEFRVRCRVRSMLGFSAHADYEELLEASRHLAMRCKQVFVVHGEERQALTYADRLREVGFRAVEVPGVGQRFEVK